jgi:hypothetical protein
LPEALQLVAFVDNQVSVDAEPTFTVVGDAEMDTVGTGEIHVEPLNMSGDTQLLHVG